MNLRPMQMADVPAVLSVQARCYGPEFIESAQAFAAKLAVVEPLGCCWVAESEGELIAYVVSLPVCQDSFPAWNAPRFEASPQATLLYLHDLAVSPAARGVGGKLVACVMQAAQALGLPEIGLIAVQDSLAYWQRHGFEEPADLPPPIAAKLLSFGAQARYLRRAA